MNLKNSAKLIDTLYYNSDSIVYNNETINPGDIVKININNLSPMIKVKEYLNKVNPSKVILNITTQSLLSLNSFKNIENLLILGNGHRIVIPGEINEKMSLTIINGTFSGFKDIIFKNKGVLTFINCTFTDNSGDYLIVNEGGCTFINCTISNNKNKKNLIDNKGSVIFINSTVSNNKYDKDGLIYNHAAVFVINSTFKSNGNVDRYNHNAGNFEIINSTCKTKYVIPEKPKEPSLFKKILGIAGMVVGLVTIVVGLVVGVVGSLATAGLLAGVGALIAIGGLTLYSIETQPNSKNNAIGELDGYLNCNLIGDNSANKLLRESLIMNCFSKMYNGKLTEMVPAEKLIQNHKELNSIIKSSTCLWNNEMKVHTFETENNKYNSKC